MFKNSTLAFDALDVADPSLRQVIKSKFWDDTIDYSVHTARASGKTYLPCQVALCQNTLDKVLMTYGGKNMLGKRLNCHSVHVMDYDYYTRHVNIDQPKKWHFWLKEPSAWSLFLAFHTGFGA